MEEKILVRIEQLRDKMNQLAMDKGLRDPDVLVISKEIDSLHNMLNEIRPPKPSKNPLIRYDYLKESIRKYTLYYTA